MAAIAAGLEMDPLFLKALTLLRSQRHESVKELGELVQEYREKISGSPLTGTKKSDGNGGKSPHIDIRVDSRNPKYNKQLQQLKDKMNEPSGSITLLKKLEEITNSNDDNSNQIAKSITQIEESIEEIIVGSSLEDKRKKQRAISDVGNFSQDAAGFSPESDIDLNDSISIDDIIEMDFDGPMCKVCQLNKRSEEENSLVECSECRSYYHQKCHRPEVSTKDLNDPRLIWYCSKCTKKMRKEMAAQQSSSSTLKTGNEVTPAPKLSNPFQQTKTFRRNLTTVTTISSDSTSNSENVARESTPSPVSNKRPRDATANSMKRLEQVKKRAKLQQQLKRK